MVYRFKMMFTADDKQLIKSLRQLQLKVTVYESFFKNFHSEIGHVEDLTACLGWQKEFKAVTNRAMHARLIPVTLLQLKCCWRVAPAS